jgi:hypothetical protein
VSRPREPDGRAAARPARRRANRARIADGHVHGARLEVRAQRGAVPDDDVQHGPRVVGASPTADAVYGGEVGQHGRQPAGSRVLQHAHPVVHALAPRSLTRVAQRPEVGHEGENALGVAQGRLARRRQRHAARCAMQQRRPDRRLKPPEVLAHRRLRGPERCGGPAQTADPRGGREAAERRQVNVGGHHATLWTLPRCRQFRGAPEGLAFSSYLSCTVSPMCRP